MAIPCRKSWPFKMQLPWIQGEGGKGAGGDHRREQVGGQDFVEAAGGGLGPVGVEFNAVGIDRDAILLAEIVGDRGQSGAVAAAGLQQAVPAVLSCIGIVFQGGIVSSEQGGYRIGYSWWCGEGAGGGQGFGTGQFCRTLELFRHDRNGTVPFNQCLIIPAVL